jgi:uncharacterized membrane protein YebE (DUF533 family)
MSIKAISPHPDVYDARRTLGKWLNEETNGKIDLQCLAALIAQYDQLQNRLYFSAELMREAGDAIESIPVELSNSLKIRESLVDELHGSALIIKKQ